MIDKIYKLINTEQLKIVLLDVDATIPSIITNEDQNFTEFSEQASLSLVQISYQESLAVDDFVIDKFYVNINPDTELVFKGDYSLHAINFEQAKLEGIIHSFSPDGEKVAEYNIDRTILSDETRNEPCMEKTTGDTYNAAHCVADDEAVEALRQAWLTTNVLFGYSVKIDGRVSFYVALNEGLNSNVTKENFNHI